MQPKIIESVRFYSVCDCCVTGGGSLIEIDQKRKLLGSDEEVSVRLCARCFDLWSKVKEKDEP